MANLIIQENGVARTTPALHGEELTIVAPCDCSAVSGVQINGEAFPFYDTLGNHLNTSLFAEGSLIRVMIDTENVRAYILNHAVTPEQIGAAKSEEVKDVVKTTGATMTGALFAANGDISIAQVRNIYAGTVDLEAGVSALPEGTIYLVYE